MVPDIFILQCTPQTRCGHDVDPKLTYPIFQGLADRVRVTISAPTGIVEFDTRDNLFTPTRAVYAESSWLGTRETLDAS